MKVGKPHIQVEEKGGMDRDLEDKGSGSEISQKSGRSFHYPSLRVALPGVKGMGKV